MEDINNEELSESYVITPEEADEMVWEALLKWLNGQADLPPHIKEIFVERSSELRLRMQAIFVEIQRKFLSQVASDAEFEDHLRRTIREDIPYMSGKEKLEALKVMTDSTEDRLKRLEAQLAGFDFFKTIETGVQSLSEAKITKSMKTIVQGMPSDKRQQLLAMLNTMVKEINETESRALGPINEPTDPAV